MYKFIMRNHKNTGHAVFYDEKTSVMYWNVGALIETDEIDFEAISDPAIKDFIQSLRDERLVSALPNYKKFREECHHCPVVQICQGAPLFETNFKEACDVAYAQSTQTLFWSLKQLTRMNLECIEGDIRRPE